MKAVRDEELRFHWLNAREPHQEQFAALSVMASIIIISALSIVPVLLNEVAGPCASAATYKGAFAAASQPANKCSTGASYQGSLQLAVVVIAIIIIVALIGVMVSIHVLILGKTGRCGSEQGNHCNE
jgi:hypothetical protein